MLLVVFGAGASYDSVPHARPFNPPSGPQTDFSPTSPYVAPKLEEDRPPLANQLFDNRPIFVDAMRRFKDCMAIAPYLRKPGISVEQELARLQGQAEKFAHVHREIAAAHYYLHSALAECQKQWRKHHHGTTNYATFLREIERWRSEFKERVCLVTFNYDTMLEDAAHQVLGLDLQSLPSYITCKDYKVIKPHGSVNWGREVDGIKSSLGFNHQRLINEITDLKISPRFRVVTEWPMLKVESAFVFPALSIPIEKKDQFACPQEHIEALAEAIPEITKMITVGWRATESKFLNMLGSRLTGLRCHPDLLIVSGSRKGAEETLQNLSHAHYSSFALVDGGFTGLITENIDLLDHFFRTTQHSLVNPT